MNQSNNNSKDQNNQHLWSVNYMPGFLLSTLHHLTIITIILIHIILVQMNKK